MSAMQLLMHVTILIVLNQIGDLKAWKPIVGQAVPNSADINLHLIHPGGNSKIRHEFLSTRDLRHDRDMHSSPSDDKAFIEGYNVDADGGDDVSSTFHAYHTSAQIETDNSPDIHGYKFSSARGYMMTNGGGLSGEDSCGVAKFAFNYDGTVQYNNKLPELEQFTICYWMRFTNHSGDHVLLTYAAETDRRALQFWIANSKNSSFLSMAIKGQQVYRLNYPLRIRQWHHTCTSWNGKTGEWQVWVRAERIGRGFHNAVVGHKIPSRGKLFSGGPSFTGKLSEGLHFELTLIQIYRVALSAGKAHRDHKHHHVHHFSHDGRELSTTTNPPPKINRPLPMHNLLANGQIPTNVRINLARTNVATGGMPQFHQQIQAQATNTKPVIGLPNSHTINNIASNAASPETHAVTIHTNFINGQFHTGSRLVTEQLIGLPAGPQPSVTHRTSTHTFNSLSNPSNVQFIDETETSVVFKRDVNAETKNSASVKAKEEEEDGKTVATEDEDIKNHKKRDLLLLQDGSIVDETDAFGYQFDGLADFGGKKFKSALTQRMNIEDEVKEYDREPAEDEVKAVMGLCSTCDLEPFIGAIVIAWKDVIAVPDNALKGLGAARCGDF